LKRPNAGHAVLFVFCVCQLQNSSTARDISARSSPLDDLRSTSALMKKPNEKTKRKVPNAKLSPKERRARRRGVQSPEWNRFAPPPRPGGPRLPLGAHPWNTGGKKGRSGRKPAAFKEMCRLLASSDLVWQSVQLILMNPHHPSFIGALKWAGENGYGKPAQKIDLKGDLKTPGRLTREEMKAELVKIFEEKE
jgi:hypothetical protein